MSSINRPFTFDCTLERCYKEPDGTPHVVGIASDDGEDLTQDRMSAKAIRSMARQCRENELPLIDNHKATFSFGTTAGGAARTPTDVQKATGAGVTVELEIDFKLDPRFPEAQVLYEEVESGKAKKQLSIGGFVNKMDPKAVRMETKDGRTIRVIDEIMLEHIATTRPGLAAVPRTRFVDAIIKDVFGDDSPAQEAPPVSATTAPSTAQPPVTTKEQVAPTTANATTPAPAAAVIDSAVAAAEEEKENAAKAIKRLSALSRFFADPDTIKDEVSLEVKALVEAAEKVQGTLTTKSADTVRKVNEALASLLSGAPVAAPVPAPAPTSAGITKEQLETIITAVVKDQLSGLAGEITSLGKQFDKAFGNLAEGLAKGLEAQSAGFKGLIESTNKQVKDQVANVAKTADDRLGRLEKGAGTVRQAIPNAGAEEAAAGSPNTTTRTPSPDNWFRGMFDKPVAQQRAARR